MVDLNLPALSVDGAPLTIGELRSALALLPELEAAIRNILAGKESWTDAEVIGMDALAILAVISPQTDAFVAIAKIVIAVAPLLASLAQPDPDPIHDAQTSTGRGGRRLG